MRALTFYSGGTTYTPPRSRKPATEELEGVQNLRACALQGAREPSEQVLEAGGQTLGEPRPGAEQSGAIQ